jgi:hypothetical protein
MAMGTLMARARALFPVLVVAVACVLTRGVATQSLSYSSGQNISPAYEGWEKNTDGSLHRFGADSLRTSRANEHHRRCSIRHIAQECV